VENHPWRTDILFGEEEINAPPGRKTSTSVQGRVDTGELVGNETERKMIVKSSGVHSVIVNPTQLFYHYFVRVTYTNSNTHVYKRNPLSHTHTHIHTLIDSI
jgi:hypothetical protein